MAHRIAGIGVGVVLTLALAQVSRAQMLGAPVLQSAFTNRGITVGADFGAGDGARTYGGAIAWSPRSMKYQLSAGLAFLDQ
ncbi:MAG: hypothetical protein ACREMU_00225, partial [Gemmatimonadaceae bacterium]